MNYSPQDLLGSFVIPVYKKYEFPIPTYGKGVLYVKNSFKAKTERLLAENLALCGANCRFFIGSFDVRRI